jgi:hypothetical protein
VKRKMEALEAFRRERNVETVAWYATTFTGQDVVLLRRMKPNDPTPFEVGFFTHEDGAFESHFQTRDRNDAVRRFTELCLTNGRVD